MHQQRQHIKSELRDLRMILRVQYILLLVFIVAAIFYVFITNSAIYEDQNMLSLRLTILNSGLFILFFVIGFFAKRHTVQILRQKSTLELGDIKKYRNLYFLRAALLETVCMCAILIFVFWGKSYALIPGLVTVLLLKVNFPTEAKVRAEIKLDEAGLSD